MFDQSRFDNDSGNQLLDEVKKNIHFFRPGASENSFEKKLHIFKQGFFKLKAKRLTGILMYNTFR